jgi:hypothetical protein
VPIISKKCPLCNEDVDVDSEEKLGLLLNPKRDKVKHPKALHICSGKPKVVVTPNTIRTTVASHTPQTKDTAASFLADQARELLELGISSTVASQADLIPVLAADMKRLDQAKGVAATNLSDDQWKAQAKGQIEGNTTTALTTSDDRYIGLVGGEKFDELHELVHILSGQGGLSRLQAFKLQLNEGSINYFSEITAEPAGVVVKTRYSTETDVVKKLVKLVDSKGGNGIKELYEMTFKGDIDGFFRSVGTAYVAFGDKKPDGTNKAFSEKGWTANQAGDEFKSKVLNWTTTWLAQRLNGL